MGYMPVLWIVWAGVAVILLILLGYRGTLTRYEEDQIFLDDAGNHQAQEQVRPPGEECRESNRMFAPR